METKKSIWTNHKIYAFILGIITGTIVYNLLGMDFSFLVTDRIIVTNFWDSFLYLIMIHLRFWIIIFILSFFKLKNKIVLLIIFVESFLIAGFITITVLAGNCILLYEIPMAVFKLVCAIFMFNEKKPVLYRGFSLIILILGTVLENIFFVKF